MTKKSIKLGFGIFGVVVSIIGLVMFSYIAYALIGLALITIGVIIFLFATYAKSDK